MPYCAAFGCTNQTGKEKNKNFYQIPDPKQEKQRSASWIHNIGNAKYDKKRFIKSKDRVVCGDHFHPDCFQRDLKFELKLTKKEKKTLVPGAIPTIFAHKIYDHINIDGTTVSKRPLHSLKRTKELERSQIVKKLLLETTIPNSPDANSVCSLVPSLTNAVPLLPEPPVHISKIKPTFDAQNSEEPTSKDVAVGTEKYFVEIATQTEEVTYVTSTPIKGNKEIVEESFDSLCKSNLTEELSTTYDKNDSTFHLPSSSSDEDTTIKMTDIIGEKKYVVYESMIDELCKLVRCPRCGSLSKNVIKRSMGTSVHCKIYCEEQHIACDWKSQPLLGKLPAFNLLISAGILFSGETFERLKKPMEYSGLNFVNSNTFYNIQRTLLIPAINKQFKENIAEARIGYLQHKGVLLGDGRFDSPGKSAKYCTYSVQSPFTQKIIATSTIQTIKGKGSSPLELKGFQNCLEELQNENCIVEIFATDRNRQLAKWLREQRPNITHKFDPWHFSKNIKAKLRPLALRKDRKIILEWIKPIGNHLFWCADNCKDDAELLREMWKSLLNHITNKHCFKKEFPKYLKCAHKPFTKKESRKKKWIKKYSPAYNAIEEVVLDKKNLEDMEHLTEPYHTGNLEVFHSLINSYASKRHEFELNVMDARVKLAVLDHNNNVDRKQAKVSVERKGSGKKGDKKFKYVSAKISKEWVAKPIMEPKSHDFIYSLLQEVVDRKLEGVNLTLKTSELTDRLKCPKNIAFTDRPEKNTILEKYHKMKRFDK